MVALELQVKGQNAKTIRAGFVCICKSLLKTDDKETSLDTHRLLFCTGSLQNH